MSLAELAGARSPSRFRQSLTFATDTSRYGAVRADSRPMRLCTRLVRTYGVRGRRRRTIAQGCLRPPAERRPSRWVFAVRFRFPAPTCASLTSSGVELDGGLVELAVSLSAPVCQPISVNNICSGRKSAVADDALPIFPAGPRLYSTPSILSSNSYRYHL